MPIYYLVFKSMIISFNKHTNIDIKSKVVVILEAVEGRNL